MLKSTLTSAALALVLLLLAGPAAALAADPDTTPPVTTIDRVADQGDYLFFNVSSNEDAIGIYCRMAGGDWITCGHGRDAHWSTPRLLSGFHVAEFASVDFAGNVEDPPVQHIFYTPPRIPSAGFDPKSIGVDDRHQWVNSSKPSFIIEKSEDPRVSYVTCAVDGNDPVPCTGSWAPTDELGDGTHMFRAQAVDELGVTSSYNPISFRIDTEAPNVSLLAPRRIPRGTPVKVKIIARDANPLRRYCELDGVQIDCSPQVLPRLKPGLHTVSADVTDIAGHETTATTKIRVTKRR